MVGKQSKSSLSSRERLLSAITGNGGASAPCSFMIFTALAKQCRDYQQLALAEMELGLDARVPLTDLPVRFAPEVHITERIEAASNGPVPCLHRTYETPVGNLTGSVRKTEDWPHGDHLPLFGDHIAPRAIKFLVTGPQDLEPLRRLLTEPTAEDIADFRSQAAARAQFAQEHGLLFTGGWDASRRSASEDRSLVGSDYGTGTLVDALMWLCGATQPLLWAYDAPDFLAELISILETYNRRRLQLHLETGVQLVFHRAWYEGAEFWSPRLYRQFILPALQREAELCHQAGVYLAYILTSGMLPLADLILESGVDVVVGLDPGQGKGTTLEATRTTLGGRLGLWGGLSGPLTIEQGTEDEVRAAVEAALTSLASTGRFILSPVDNVTETTQLTWRNITVLIETWRRITES